MTLIELQKQNEILERKNLILEDEIERLNVLLRDLKKASGLLNPEVPACFGLTGKEAMIFSIIMARPIARKEEVMAWYVSEYAEADIPDPKIVDVFVCKLRKKAKLYGIDVQTKWGEGYFMTEATKAQVRKILKDEQGELQHDKFAA